MIIKDFLYKLKQDFTYLPSLTKYRDYNANNGVGVNYDKYWQKRFRWDELALSNWQKQRSDLVLKIIEPNSKILDCGCGNGSVLKYLKEKINISGIGVDISEDALIKAKKNGIDGIKMDITNLDSLNDLPEVDYILGFEIIEHMPNPEEFINKIQNKARIALIFSVPNTGYYIQRLRLLFGRFPQQWISHPGEHLRFWTVKDMEWWIEAVGFELDKIVLYEGLPILNKIFPKLFCQGIIVKIKSK